MRDDPHKLPDVVEAVERAVSAACSCYDADTARKLTRVEVDHDTMDGLIAWARPGFYGDVLPLLRGEGPVNIRGVSYYHFHRLSVSWRVIAPAVDRLGRLSAATTTEEKVKAEG